MATSPHSLRTTERFSIRVTLRPSVTIPLTSWTIRAGGGNSSWALSKRWRIAATRCARAFNLFSAQSDWISYRAVVSTSPDQIAVAPGYLQREWVRDGRRYFEYSMGGTHIADFYAYLSGRYAVRKEAYQGPNGAVNLEVYYEPAHTFNIDAMLAAIRAGLNHFQQSYSPYQYTQYRVMEFPRYRTFAQSFPNSVPFSEGIGFIERLVNADDVDMTYFVTAHELAHQWWGHQLVGGNVEGSNMMSETLAQYSAYMPMQRKYGKDYMRIVLRHFLDRYLRRGLSLRLRSCSANPMSGTKRAVRSCIRWPTTSGKRSSTRRCTTS